MLELTNEFTIDRPLVEVWPVLTDLPSIAQAIPGAQIDDVESDGTHHGGLRIKLGAFVATFRGQAHYTALDHDAHEFVLEGSGRSPQGNATLRLTGSATDEGGSTRVLLTSTVQLTGRLAQFGGSMAGDVAKPMIDAFVENFANGFVAADDHPEPAASTASDPAPADGGAARAAQPRPTAWQGRSADAMELPSGLLPDLSKFAPLALAAVVGLVGGLVFGRRRRSGPAVTVVLLVRPGDLGPR
jgi:carbon monoxide dehydrogenase subunit G